MGDMPAPPLSFTLFGLASLYDEVAAIDVAVIAGNDEAVVVEAQSLGFSRNTVQLGAEDFVARFQISTRQAGVARKAEDLIEPAPADGRSLIFGDVVVRVSNSYALAMHIDTDESNAACVGRDTKGEIVR